MENHEHCTCLKRRKKKSVTAISRSATYGQPGGDSRAEDLDDQHHDVLPVPVTANVPPGSLSRAGLSYDGLFVVELKRLGVIHWQFMARAGGFGCQRSLANLNYLKYSHVLVLSLVLAWFFMCRRELAMLDVSMCS